MPLGPAPFHALGLAPFHGPALGPGPLARPLFMVRPLAPCPDPDFDFLGGFPRVAKRFWPLRPPIGLIFDPFAITRRSLPIPGDGFSLKGLWLETAIPRFSGFWPDMAPATLGPDPNFVFWGGFQRVAKRFWPLRPPIGLRFAAFAITRRGLTVPCDGSGLKRPMARDRHPAFFRIFGAPLPGPLLYAYYPRCGWPIIHRWPHRKKGGWRDVLI